MDAVLPDHRTIAYLCVATHLGGAERSLLDLVLRIREHTAGWYRPLMILPTDQGPLVDRIARADLPWTVLPMPKGFFGMSRSRPVRSLLAGALSWTALRTYNARLQELLEEHRPAILHTTGLKCHVLSARLEMRIPILWHLRDVLAHGGTRLLLRRLRRGKEIHVVSNSYATASAFEPEDTKPFVVFNGIDTQLFRPGRDPVYHDWFGVGDDVPIVGIVGVLQRGKGLHEFIDMAARLREEKVRARYVVVGDEIYDSGRDEGLRVELEQQVERLKLTREFAFTGFQEDNVRVMHGLDLLVSASTEPESFGRVLIEAMACGVPVVASAHGGSLEIIEDRRSGRLFAPGDVGAMARVVRELLESQELREVCVRGGLARVAARFTVDNYVAGVVRTYDRILGPLYRGSALARAT